MYERGIERKNKKMSGGRVRECVSELVNVCGRVNARQRDGRVTVR